MTITSTLKGSALTLDVEMIWPNIHLVTWQRAFGEFGIEGVSPKQGEGNL